MQLALSVFHLLKNIWSIHLKRSSALDLGESIGRNGILYS